MNQAAQTSLIDLLEKDPQQAGYRATFWTVAMRTLALLNRVGIRLSERGLRQPRQRLGLRWTRPRLSLPDKTAPHKATKQGAIAKAILDAPGDTVVGYADQSRLQWLPLRRRMGQWAGKQRRIPTPGSKVTRPLFGALNSFSAQWPYRVRHAARTADFVAFLEYLLNVYPTVPIILIVDHFSSHTAHAVADWLALHPRLPLFYLPLYGSPLNPVETLWLRLKISLLLTGGMLLGGSCGKPLRRSFTT